MPVVSSRKMWNHRNERGLQDTFAIASKRPSSYAWRDTLQTFADWIEWTAKSVMVAVEIQPQWVLVP